MGPKKIPAAISRGKLGIGLITTAKAMKSMYANGANLPARDRRAWIRSGLKYVVISHTNWERKKMRARSPNKRILRMVFLLK
jgi:hypothetical protein